MFQNKLKGITECFNRASNHRCTTRMTNVSDCQLLMIYLITCCLVLKATLTFVTKTIRTFMDAKFGL